MAQPYIGEIRMFAGNFAPAGWELCHGQLLPISGNDTLFAIIGTTYGGDGESTFAVPDLRSRFPLHQGGGYVIGETAGAESVTLTTNQIPAHSHTAIGSAATATASSPAAGTWSVWPGGPYADAGAGAAMSADAIGAAGGSQPHENMPPYLAVNFIISLFGLFPSPN